VINRLRFCAAIAIVVASPFSVRAQSPRKVVTVGFLSNLSPGDTKYSLDALRAGLRDLGYVLGIAIPNEVLLRADEVIQ